MFDVAADSVAIDTSLKSEPWLAPQVTGGIRVPGAWDGFETAVRAILGQQVSVARARNLAISLMAQFGGGDFPTPANLVDADVSAIGMPGKRGEAVRALAGAILDGQLQLDAGADPESQFATLCGLPGIGPWTARLYRHAHSRRCQRLSAWRLGGAETARHDRRCGGTDRCGLAALSRLCAHVYLAAFHCGEEPAREQLAITHYTFMPSPVGELLLAGNDDQLEVIGFSSGSKARGADPEWERWDYPFRFVRKQLLEYFAGERKVFELPLSPQATPFQARVLDELLKIPYGETCTYLDIAKTLGNPKASRAVGMANGNNPIPIIIPCHRVVGSNGSLTGFGGGLPSKRFLLDLEAANSGLFA